MQLGPEKAGINFRVEHDALCHACVQPADGIAQRYVVNGYILVAVAATGPHPLKTAGKLYGDHFIGHTRCAWAGQQFSHNARTVAGFFDQFPLGCSGEILLELTLIAHQSGRQFQHATLNRDSVLFHKYYFTGIGDRHDDDHANGIGAVSVFPVSGFFEAEITAAVMNYFAIFHSFTHGSDKLPRL